MRLEGGFRQLACMVDVGFFKESVNYIDKKYVLNLI